MSMRNAPSDLPDAPIIVWFRRDLRISDNAALSFAANSGRPVIALFIHATDDDETVRPGGAQRWWLHHSLTALASKLKEIGLDLVLRCGPVAATLDSVIDETGAESVVWNRRYAPAHIRTDTAIRKDLTERGLTVMSHEGPLLHEPTQVKTGQGGFYRVYSPFWRALAPDLDPRPPFDAPGPVTAFDGDIASDALEDWGLLPTKPDWSTQIAKEWQPGEDAAATRLDWFVKNALSGYDGNRDIPAKDATSRLSPHLAFGEITPFQIWDATRNAGPVAGRDIEKFRKELVWREFAYHLLVNTGDLKHANYNGDFDAFPWIEADAEVLQAWQRGQTGYPIVDAGMRQLWQTGWMHNRVRMIVGSFLVKHLLIDWRHGEKWFWDTLVDADPASNTASWQWVAGSGADAAPYFRIFNPIIQGEKFDPKGDYVRLYVPELAKMPDSHIHKPWEAAGDVLEKAGVSLGDDYPRPIVDHRHARQRALDAYQSMRGAAA